MKIFAKKRFFDYRRIAMATCAAVLTLLVGCETTSHGQEGDIVGGVLGGLIGAQIGEGRGNTAAIIIGAIAGSMIGRHVGESMEDNDRMMTSAALYNSRTDERTTWTNPDTGHLYTVTPTETFQQNNGPCREFRLDATIGNEANQAVYGTACLQADGSWLVQ